jgi:hypothetical protein
MKGYEMETRIETTKRERHINVDAHENGVWLSLIVDGGRCHATLTKDQAKDMIAALIRIVDGQEYKNALVLARVALSHTATDLHHSNFELEEKALVAIDTALEQS